MNMTKGGNKMSVEEFFHVGQTMTDYLSKIVMPTK